MEEKKFNYQAGNEDNAEYEDNANYDEANFDSISNTGSSSYAGYVETEETAETTEQKEEISYRVVESFGAQANTNMVKESKDSTFRVKVLRGDEAEDESNDLDKIREENLREFYHSAYYQNVQRKKSKRIKVIAVLAALMLIYLGFVAIGGALISGKDKVAGTESEKLEMDIEEKYGVIVNTGKEINANQNDYMIYELDSNAQTYEALRAIDIILDRLPQDFIDDIAQKDEGRYLEINVTGEMVIPNNGGYAAGLTSFASDKNVIRIDATSGLHMDLQAIFAHELFHLIDYEMKQFDKYAASIDEWEMYNPTQFEYSAWQSSNSNYILEGSDISNTYFVTAYSKQDVFEDRAEIFSYILATDEDGNLPESYNSQYVRAKCRLLIGEIKQHFDSASKNMYIERWFD